jgi:sugar phosphate isomerase/epimerase
MSSNLSFGCNTAGFAGQPLDAVLTAIADCGYRGVALTLDTHHCNPFTADPPALTRLRQLVETLHLRVSIETSAPRLLHPDRDHYPTLVSNEGRQIRLELLRRAVDIARALGAECVNFWSGAAENGTTEHQAWDWLVTGCLQLTEHAKRRGVQLAFEPKAGMLVDDMAKFEVLKKHIASARFGLTLDVEHVLRQETAPFRQVYGKFANLIRNIHLTPAALARFQENELEFTKILRVLADNKYAGLIHVEPAAAAARSVREFCRAAAGPTAQRDRP